MAEPQATTSTDKARTRDEASSAAAKELRSFGETQARQRGEDLARPAIETSRRLAESGRYAGRQMSEAWRLALDPLLAVQLDMSRMFDDMWRQTFGFRQTQASHPLRAMGLLGASGIFGLPPTDLKETKQAHELDIELPGLNAKDIDISVDGDALIICGNKLEENTDATAAYRMSERRYGRFERVFPLPLDVDRERIEAQFRDGVLKITLPKEREAAAHRSRIEVKG